MLENLLPNDYLPYLEYVPDLRVLVNVAIPLAPLYTYGTTCWSIHKRKTSVGYSIDICATMLISSILRILYYFISPYELSLLQQSVVMIAIQCVLLKVSLAYRPHTYNPDALSDTSAIWEQLETLPLIALVPALESDSVLTVSKNVLESYAKRSIQVAAIWSQYVLSLFDVYYKRPGLFWQWSLERLYWRFLQIFTISFTVLTLIFRSSPLYGAAIGGIGLFVEALLPLPQIMMIHRLQSVANFKVILLVLWLSGDCLKLSYLFYGTDNVLTVFFAAAFFQMGLDLIVLAQYLHFSKQDVQMLPTYELPTIKPSQMRHTPEPSSY